MTNNFSASNVATQKSGDHGRDQERRDGDDERRATRSSQYTILVQDYPSPIPNGSGFRYSQSGYTRQTVGGCGFWNKDANYANSTMLPTIDSTVLGAAERSRACRTSRRWTSPRRSTAAGCARRASACSRKRDCPPGRAAGAVDKTEWINQIRTVTAIFPPYEIQEDIHPNYWGQLALRNCLTQAYNAGAPKGGTCTISATGLNSAGEPNMSLH